MLAYAQQRRYARERQALTQAHPAVQIVAAHGPILPPVDSNTGNPYWQRLFVRDAFGRYVAL